MGYYIKYNKNASDNLYEKLGSAGTILKSFVSDMAAFNRTSNEMIDIEESENVGIDYSNLKMYLNLINTTVGKPERYDDTHAYSDKNGYIRKQVLEKIYAIRGIINNIEQAIQTFERQNLSLKNFMEKNANVSASFDVSDLDYEYLGGAQRMYYTDGEKKTYFSEAVNSSISDEVHSILGEYGLNDLSDVNAATYGKIYGIIDFDSN